MARIELAPEVLEDFDRFCDHLVKFETADAPRRIGEIVQSIDVLAHSPVIGRPARAGLRELVIGKAGRGYVALYRFVPEIDTVFVLVVRSQREFDFKRPSQHPTENSARSPVTRTSAGTTNRKKRVP